jgi:hypothetical protein
VVIRPEPRTDSQRVDEGHRRFTAYREPLRQESRDLLGMRIEAAVAACQLKAGTAEPRGLHGFHF